MIELCKAMADGLGSPRVLSACGREYFWFLKFARSDLHENSPMAIYRSTLHL